MILGGGKNMLSSIFSLVEGILSSAGASAEAQNIVSTVFDSILKGIAFWLIEPDDSKRRLPDVGRRPPFDLEFYKIWKSYILP